MKWSEDELHELNHWADYGDKGLTCPWRVVAECVNRESGNNRSVKACQQRWAKYILETDNNHTHTPYHTGSSEIVCRECGEICGGNPAQEGA